MNAVARPEDMTTRNTLVRLHEIKAVFANDLGDGVGKAAIPVDPTEGQRAVRRIDDFHKVPNGILVVRSTCHEQLVVGQLACLDRYQCPLVYPQHKHRV